MSGGWRYIYIITWSSSLMISHKKILMSIALATILAVLCTGCITAQPELAITSPADNAVVNDSSVVITVEVKNFNLVESGSTNVAGQGHLVYYFDAVPPTEPGQPATTTPGTYAVSANTTYVWEHAGVGEHVLAVQLVNNDNTPLDPFVTSTVTVMVQQPGLLYCTQYSDCVPAQCCHPTSCINKDYKEVCDVFCTASCEGPIDCGAGSCGCVNNQCQVIPSNV